jgi:hypothetical protein
MKTTLLKLALNPAELSEMGEMLTDSAFPTRGALIDPFQDLVNQLEDSWCAAALYRIDTTFGQHYHQVGFIDENGVTFTVDDAQTLTTTQLPMRPTVHDMSLIEKGARYDHLLSALGTHKLRLFQADMSESMDTESDLLKFLSTLSVKGDDLDV